MLGDNERARQLLREAVAISRETGMGYIGPMILGYLAHSTNNDPSERLMLLQEGEELIREERLAHNVLFFLTSAIEARIEDEDPGEVMRYTQMLEEGLGAEPLPCIDFLARRGRLLARVLAGERGTFLASELTSLASEAQAMGYLTFSPRLAQAAERSCQRNLA
jgi:hypothetical protein